MKPYRLLLGLSLALCSSLTYGQAIAKPLWVPECHTISLSYKVLCSIQQALESALSQSYGR